MQFHVDIDEGFSIRGWVIPDNPAHPGRIIVRVENHDDLEVEANVLRADIRDAGIHPTGLVGFTVDENLIPRLAEVQSISLLESDTKVLIYRRFNINRHLQKRLAFFNQAIFPNSRMIAKLSSHFAMSHSFVERYPLETMLYIVRTHFTDSVMVMGRPNFNRYATWMREMGFHLVALLKDPFEDLAERLIFLDHISKSENASAAMNFATGLLPLTDLVKRLDMQNEKQMNSIFRSAGDAEKRALRNPMTRTFGCDNEEEAERRNVSIALDNLAGMDVVGLSTRYPEFRASVTAVLGADVLPEDGVLKFDAVDQLAARLAKAPIVLDLLEHDLALYSFAKEAIEAAFAKDLSQSS
jgi:hypothetical protein